MKQIGVMLFLLIPFCSCFFNKRANEESFDWSQKFEGQFVVQNIDSSGDYYLYYLVRSKTFADSLFKVFSKKVNAKNVCTSDEIEIIKKNDLLTLRLLQLSFFPHNFPGYEDLEVRSAKPTAYDENDMPLLESPNICGRYFVKEINQQDQF